MSAPGEGPPRLARALLAWLLPVDDRGPATGDLDEEYTRYIRPARGRVSAHAWYWRQVLLSAPGLLWRRWGRASDVAGSVGHDLRFAVRILRRRPGFSIAAAATLALGLGANATVFSVVNAVLLQPLPYQDADRLVRPLPNALFFLNPDEAVLVEERMTTFESFAAWGRTLFLFADGGSAEEVRGARVAWNHFGMLGVDPLLGRTFSEADADTDDVVVLSHGLWTRRFGADPAVVGRTTDLSGRRVTIIGVLRPNHVPIEFDWQAWRVLPSDVARIAGMGLAANARLRPGVTVEQARDELRQVLPGIWAQNGYFASDEERASLEMAALGEWLVGDVSRALWVLAGAVGFVLLLACVNVANLLLAQSGSRRQEFAVRTALGGGRTRLARQVLIEVLLLAAVGGAAALALSTLSLGWFAAQLPASMPRLGAIRISGTVIAFATVVTLFVALATGLFPAWRAGGRSVARDTRSGRGSSAGRDRVRLRSMLVASEVAIAVVLVVGAGLMIRTLAGLQSVDPGFDASEVVTVRLSPPSARYSSGEELTRYYDELSAGLAAIPGVASVGAIQFLPMTPGGWWASYLPEGTVLQTGENAPNAAMRVVLDGYFETMRIPLVAGRVVTAADADPEGQPAAVVNQAFADEAFPGDDAVGRFVTVDESVVEIVGVVADVHQSDLRTTSHAEMYIPFGASPWRRMHMVVRFEDGANQSTQAVADVLRGVDPEVSMVGPRPMAEVVGATLGRARLVTALLTLFGVVGLGLGAVGVYGVTAQSMAERRREIGIRLALGAEAAGVTRETVLRGLRPVALGAAFGVGGAFLATRFLEGLLFDVASTDPATFVTAPAVLVVVALLSLLLPALRASRVDPVRTLREE